MSEKIEARMEVLLSEKKTTFEKNIILVIKNLCHSSIDKINVNYIKTKSGNIFNICLFRPQFH